MKNFKNFFDKLTKPYNFIKKIIGANLNFILSLILIALIIISSAPAVLSAARNPGHAWGDLEDTALGVTLGGTNLTAYTKGDILYSDNTDSLARLGIGAGGTVLASSGGIPVWIATTTLANISGSLGETKGGLDQTTYTLGDMLYADATNNLAKLPIGTAGKILASFGGIPTWIATNTPVKVQTFTGNGTYTPTAGMTKALVIVASGGGAERQFRSKKVRAFSNKGHIFT